MHKASCSLRWRLSGRIRANWISFQTLDLYTTNVRNGSGLILTTFFVLCFLLYLRSYIFCLNISFRIYFSEDLQVVNNITVFVYLLVSIVASEKIAVSLTDAPLKVNCLVFFGYFQDFLCVFGFLQFHYFVSRCRSLFIYCRSPLGLLHLWIDVFHQCEVNLSS